MGLDMYAFRINRLTDEDIKKIIAKNTREIRDMGYGIFIANKNDIPEGLEDLTPMLTFVNVNSGNGEEVTCAIFKCEEVGYWRKAYELQENIHYLCDKEEIENCGWYRCNRKMIDAMRTIHEGCGKLNQEIIIDDILGGHIFYHEWY